MDALFFSLLVHTPPLRRPSSLLFPSLFKTPLSLSLSLSLIYRTIMYVRVCMYACMYLTEFPSCLLIHSLNSATGRRSAKKRKLPWRWPWFAVRLKLKLKMEHDQLIKTTRLIRTRTLTSLSPSSSQQALQPQHPIICGSAQLRSCSICSAHAHVSPRPTRSSCEVNISIPRDPPTTNRQKG